MRCLQLVGMLFLVVFFASISHGEEPKKEMIMDGTWIATSAEMAGEKLPEEFLKAITMVLKGDQYTVTIGETVDKGTSKVDTKAKPMTLDITGTEGPNKGKKILGIAEMKGDTLKVCYDLEGKKYPKEFKSEKGSKHFLIVYKREKK